MTAHVGRPSGLRRPEDDAGREARAKPLPRRLPIAGQPPDLVPARMISEVLYCERLFYLEWVQGEFADNVFTVDGRMVHKRADQAGGALPPLPAGEGEKTDASGGEGNSDAHDPDRPYQARSVWLSSETLGMTAKIDVVDGDGNGRVVPIEYKRGTAPEVDEGAYLPQRAQLAAHVLLLRDAGYTCDEAAIYFAGSKRRVAIAIDDALLETAKRAAARAKELALAPEIPAPLVDSPKCNGCSLIGICLPDEVNLLARSAGIALDDRAATEAAPGDPASDVAGEDAWEPAPPTPSEDAIRRLHPARDDKLPLYVQAQGARISLSGELLSVWTKEGVTEARIGNTSQVSVFGNVQITTPALRALFERDIPVSYFSYGGYYLGRAVGHDSKNVELRVAQYRATIDPATCLALARGFVASKIRNCRTLLRRNAEGVSPVTLGELEILAKKAEDCPERESLLGIEGAAARLYFETFPAMLGGRAVAEGFDLDGRNRRPPKDPVNALLSFLYSLLAKDFTVTLGAVGLDPLLGFYHQPRFGRPALALDLMEEFRPLIGDSVVLGVVNTGVVTDKDFVRAAGAVSLRPAARRNVLLAYERRMDQLVTHPVFGYRISYRRVLEVQARLLGRFLLGEIPAYPSFRTR